MNSGGSDRAAVLMLALGAGLISTTGILVSYADVPATVSGFWRMAFGGGILAVALLALRQWRPAGPAIWLWMLLPAMAMAVDLALWHRSILSTGPGLATLLSNFQVFFMALAGFVLYRERLGPRFLAGLLLAFLGTWLLVGIDWAMFAPAYRAGIVMGILSGLAYAVYLLSFRHAQQRGARAIPAAQLLAINSLLCAACLGLAALAERAPLAIPDSRSLLALVSLGIVGQCLGWVLITRAMPRLPASTVGLLLLLQPALAFVLDVFLFQRQTSAVDWLGLALALGGIFIGTLRLADRRTPLPLAEDAGAEAGTDPAAAAAGTRRRDPGGDSP